MNGAGIGCCSYSHGCGTCQAGSLTRRGFLARGAALSLAPQAVGAARDPARQAPIRLPLRVQPAFLYQIKTPQKAASWRFSAEIHTEKGAAEERGRIQRDLAAMKAQAEFPIELLPLATVHDAAQAAALAQENYDALIMYAAGYDRKVMDAMARPDRWNLVFVRHKSGPMYYMYIGVHPHFLRKTTDDYRQPGMDEDDVVVDSHAELLWRLRSFYALKNTLGKRIVAIGAPGGWGEGGRNAPERARGRWKLDIPTVPYTDLEARIRQARQNAALMKRAEQAAQAYLSQEGVRLETPREFVSKAFVLTEVFRDILDEAKADAITVGGCMRAIMPVSETTACLALSVLNDEGYLAFCESDFVVIPSGILLHYISNKPVFFCNASFPYNGIATLSHCTAPRRMDGAQAEPVRLLTHYESDYGAAPKVEMRKGQAVTILNPDFAGKRWAGFGGKIAATPFFPICRTQLEISLKCDGARLARELKGFHWMACYGDYLRETGYAVKKAGVGWLEVA